MKIKELNSVMNGTEVVLRVVLSKKEVKPKNGGGTFVNISLTDSTGNITFPIFENVYNIMQDYEVGVPYEVSGIVNHYNGCPQLKKTTFKKITEYNKDEFIDSYIIKDKYLNEFMSMIDKLSEPWKTLSYEALDLNTNKNMFNKFMECPSAKTFHGNKLGGLFYHTYGVMKNIENIINTYSDLDMYGDVNKVINKDRLMFKALIHDIEKTDEYIYDTYINRKDNVIGHIIDGVVFVCELNKRCNNILSDEELEDIKYSLLSHHGTFGPYEPKTIEDLLLNLADNIDAQIVKEIEQNN